ncbi:MAG TPA: rod shape-determining protein RodA [Bacteroidia bacterium]|nr:rod shape-determining protein RodA [Bacteroidia bacterium]
MKRNSTQIVEGIDWTLVAMYVMFVCIGWMNVYAAVYNDAHSSIFDMSQKYGKQLIWIGTGFLLAIIILIVDVDFYTVFAWPIYVFSMFMLVAVMFLGTTISGSKSWFRIGEVGIQPAEFAKFAVNLALAKFLSNMDINMDKLATKIKSFLIILLPVVLILLENETGVAMVYLVFILVLYREGLSGNMLLLGFLGILLFALALVIDKIILISVLSGIAVLFILVIKKKLKNILLVVSVLILACGAVVGTNYAFSHLHGYQKKRLDVFLGKGAAGEKTKSGYNVNQAKISIGSGGFTGKGFLQGTQTKYDFVPEQATDFIFCTIGEEWGFLGSAFIVIAFMFFIVRIVFLAERQRSLFSRIYGYGVACIFFFHVLVNIGMTIGLVPVIGIPLPFFSYGGSSLWSFTILLFIFIKLDSSRLLILR